MKNTNFHARYILLSAIALTSLVLSCNTDPVRPDLNPDYDLTGAAVVDLNQHQVTATVSLSRNDTTLTTADLALGADPFVYQADALLGMSLYRLADTTIAEFVDQTKGLSVSDTDLLNDTLLAALPGEFTVGLINPPNHLIQGNGSATISWTGSAGTERYVIAAVKAGQAYTGAGYSAYSIQGTSGTIPPDAFLIPGTTTADTGLFNLYVYSMTGAPDSAMADVRLPVPLPEQLTDNIADGQLTGRFGAVLVAVYDTVRVAAQQ